MLRLFRATLGFERRQGGQRRQSGQRRSKMRDDATLLIGGDDQGRQARGVSHLLKRRDLRCHFIRRAADDIVPRDVDAGDQAFFGERRHLGKGRVADDEMPAETNRFRGLGLQRVALADLEGDMRTQHGQRRQAPQQEQKSSGDPTAAPDAAADQHDDDGDARHHQHRVSRSTQRDHVGIVVVDAREQQQ
jgi:hypothetical protein